MIILAWYVSVIYILLTLCMLFDPKFDCSDIMVFGLFIAPVVVLALKFALGGN